MRILEDDSLFNMKLTSFYR